MALPERPLPFAGRLPPACSNLVYIAVECCAQDLRRARWRNGRYQIPPPFDVTRATKADEALYAVELKWDRSPEAAIAQVRERDYPAVLRGFGGPILLVGITYDRKSKRHVCRIEKTRFSL